MREKPFLRRQYAAILTAIGSILCMAAGVMLTPLATLFIHPEESRLAGAFLLPALAMGALGWFLRRLRRTGENPTLSIQDGGVIVVLSWATVVLFCAWPIMIASEVSFSRACFESMSAWTTTGLSVLDVTAQSHTILMWRSIMQLAGGAGFAIIMMAAIVGPTGVGLSSAEGRSEQLVPSVRASARLVLIMYVAYAVVGALAYRLAGMSFFDAINHSFCAVSTGGFSTRVESIGAWDSVAVEAVTLPLMFLGNLSFVTAWHLWTGRFAAVARNGEVRLFVLALPFAAALVFFFSTGILYQNLEKATRVAIFETMSALTTTGFSTVGYGDWNAPGIAMLIVLMLIGGGAASTAGGLKQFRVQLAALFIYWELKRLLLPRSAVLACPVWEGAHRVFLSDARVRQVCVFILLYLAMFAAGTFLLCAHGYSLSDSMFEFASAQGTVGLSVGITSATMPDAVLWAEIVAMFLGRLEFIVVITSLVKIGRDVGRMAR